jgi:NAD(P)H-quinone oxidoreductase subunit 4
MAPFSLFASLATASPGLGSALIPAPWAAFPWLSLLLVIPFVGTFALLLWPGESSPGRLRGITIAILAAQLLASLALLLVFDPPGRGCSWRRSTSGFQALVSTISLGWMGSSLPLVLINGAFTLVAAVCTRDFSKRPRIYFSMLLLISGAVNGAFLAENLLLFFLFYELELIPLWLLISIWEAAAGPMRPPSS